MQTSPGNDAEAYRTLARAWAASVTVVAARRPGDHFTPAAPQLDGFTATSFLTVSIDPPLILISAAKGSGALALVQDVTHFAVNLLASDQREQAEAFARTQAERGEIFSRFSWHPDPDGSPVLEGIVGAFSARIRDRVDAGDHVLVVGEVTLLHQGSRTDTLIYHNRAFRQWSR